MPEVFVGDVFSIGWSTGLGGDMLMVGGSETGITRGPIGSQWPSTAADDDF